MLESSYFSIFALETEVLPTGTEVCSESLGSCLPWIPSSGSPLGSHWILLLILVGKYSRDTNSQASCIDQRAIQYYSPQGQTPMTQSGWFQLFLRNFYISSSFLWPAMLIPDLSGSTLRIEQHEAGWGDRAQVSAWARSPRPLTLSTLLSPL